MVAFFLIFISNFTSSCIVCEYGRSIAIVCLLIYLDFLFFSLSPDVEYLLSSQMVIITIPISPTSTRA